MAQAMNSMNNSNNHNYMNGENDSENIKDYVILDCDIGTDDAWALYMLIKAEKLRKFKILGVTCVNGNTTVHNVAINTLRVLSSVNRIDIPVFKGASTPLIFKGQSTSIFHGNDGFGDVEHDKQIDKNLIQNIHAVQAMYDFVCKYPKQISFFLVGPLTNFALCLNMYSDFAEKIKHVYIMGGNLRAVGNATSTAEFNFYSDPEAAFIVLDRICCPITILPWEACHVDFNKDTIPLEWRFDVLGSVNNEVTALMNPVEKNVYIPKGFDSWMPCDAILIAAYLFPDKIIKKQSLWQATVELNGFYTRGQVVLEHRKDKEKIKNVCFIEQVCVENFKNIALWTVNYDGITMS